MPVTCSPRVPERHASSPGEFHILRSNSGSTDVACDWGRRGLRLSGDWFPSRLRSASSGAPSGSQGSHTPTTSNRMIPRAPRHGHPPQTAPAAFLPSPSTTPGPSHHHLLTNKATTATTQAARQKRPSLYLVTPLQHHHHRIPRSRSTHAVTRSRTGGVRRCRLADATNVYPCSFATLEFWRSGVRRSRAAFREALGAQCVLARGASCTSPPTPTPAASPWRHQPWYRRG